VETLAQFAALRREELATRLGVESALLWDVVNGGRDRLLRLVRPPADFAEKFEFEHPVEMMEPLLFVLRRMLGDLCQRLANVWLVASTMKLGLRFEDQLVYENSLRVAEPTRDADLLLRVLHTHLEGRSASAPIVEASVELTPVRPANLQTNLFERRLRDPNQFSETLARLEALLGRGNVGRVELLPSRRQDAFAVVNYLEGVHGQRSTVNSHSTSKPSGLPLWRFRPPQPVEVMLGGGKPEMIHAPAGSQVILEAKGPWLMSGDWWDRHGWAREVWEVSTTNGSLYQLTWEKSGWVLDGIFG
jgi:protein ImuB